MHFFFESLKSKKPELFNTHIPPPLTINLKKYNSKYFLLKNEKIEIFWDDENKIHIKTESIEKQDLILKIGSIILKKYFNFINQEVDVTLTFIVPNHAIIVPTLIKK